MAETVALAASETVSAGPPAAAPPVDPLKALEWGFGPVQTGKYDEAGRMIIEVFFGGPEQNPQLPEWTDWAKAAVWEALAQYEKIIDVVFRETLDPDQRDFGLIGYPVGSPDILLGEFDAPGEPNAGRGIFAFNGRGWTPEGLQQGGYGFVTLVHEFGHGMGLAHPHDEGGGPSEILPGVTGQFDPGPRFQPGGQFSNQAVWTMMSYVDGWHQHPQGNIDVNEYGNIGGPMAWDIALLQRYYGANTEWNAGNDIYVLPAQDGVGTFYSAIWDAGGEADWMIAGEALDVTIDLRAATLLYEDGGAGWVSHARGVHGGFTIANGVVIEHAEGGAGADLLIGNAADNLLRGLGGADTLVGLAGDDRLLGGEGDDRLEGGEGIDTADYSQAAAGVTVRLALTGRQNTVGAGRDQLTGIENLDGSAFDDVLSGDWAANQLMGGDGNDRLDGLGGNDALVGGLGDDRMSGGEGDDELVDVEGGADVMYGGAGNDRFTLIRTVASQDRVILNGDAGSDEFRIAAAGGPVFASGGEGDDTFILRSAATVTGGIGSDSFKLDIDFDFSGPVTITDFVGGIDGDRLDLLDFLDFETIGFERGNPFDTGFLRLVASGANTLMQVDRDAGATDFDWSTLVILKNFPLNGLTLFNLFFQPPSVILGTAGNDTLNGGRTDDTIQGLAGNDTLKGQAGDDVLEGGDGDDLLYGLTGQDSLLGGAGADKLTAGDGADILDGGAGADNLIGGLGGDRMTGGVGADTFVFTAVADSQGDQRDLILDFAFGQGDRISLVGIDADTATAGNQAFAFAAAFTGVAGQLVRSFDAVSGRTTVSGDVNGDGIADLVFEMAGDHTASTAGWLL